MIQAASPPRERQAMKNEDIEGGFQRVWQMSEEAKSLLAASKERLAQAKEASDLRLRLSLQIEAMQMQTKAVRIMQRSDQSLKDLLVAQRADLETQRLTIANPENYAGRPRRKSDKVRVRGS